MKKSLTIRDVAKRAGVSISTVSHVINETRFVSKDATERVKEAISELKYYPNLLVRSLRGKGTFTVGLILPSISNETFGKLAENIQRILLVNKYNTIICITSNNLKIETEAIKTLLSKKVDGIIIIPTAKDASEFIEIESIDIPIIFIDRFITGLNVNSILFDYYSAAYEIVEYLIELGHRIIGYIDRPFEHSHSIAQRKGYIDALEKHDIIFDKGLIIQARDFSYSAGAKAAKELIKKVNNITAIFAFYDIIALGVMRGIIDEGYRIPEDISVAGCDGMPFTDFCIPKLTTAKLPLFTAAKNICEILLKRIKDPSENKIKNVILKPKLVIRESTSNAKI